MNLALALPIVTNADREWAVAQCPSWCRRGDISEICGELVDDDGWLDGVESASEDDTRPNFSILVMEEAERFERHYAGEIPLRRPYTEWSSIWRRGWWPKVEPRKRFPKSAPKIFQPFFRAGSAEFEKAITVATAKERRMWKQFGVAQFSPDDPRLSKVAQKSQA